MLTESQKKRRDRWQRNKEAERARKAPPAPPPPPAITPEMVAQAEREAAERVRAAVMPDDAEFIFALEQKLREHGVPHSGQDLFELWYFARNNPKRPNRDIWRMSDSARDFTADVWAARTLVEHQRGPGKATAGKIAKLLEQQGRAREYTAGSLRVMVQRALDRIKRIEAAAAQPANTSAQAPAVMSPATAPSASSAP